MSRFNTPPMILRPHEDPTVPQSEYHLAELALAKQMAEILQKLYPGHRWAAHADIRGQFLAIAIPALMGAITWHIEDIKKVQDYPAMVTWLRRAGGEILERFRMKRGAFDVVDFQAAKKLRIKSNKEKMPE